MKEVMIVGATRTPIGSFRGSLSSLSAVELGAVAVRHLLENSGLREEQVDELIFGQVLTAGCGQNPARQTAASPPDYPSARRRQRSLVCGAGLKAVQLAAQAIRCGDADVAIAGGQESMSNAPICWTARVQGCVLAIRAAGQHDYRRAVGRVQRLSHGYHR